MDLDAIWQVHLWGPVTHCVRGVSDPRGKGDLGLNPQPRRAKFSKLQRSHQSYAAPGECKRGERFRLLPNYFGLCLFHVSPLYHDDDDDDDDDCL